MLHQSTACFLSCCHHSKGLEPHILIQKHTGAHTHTQKAYTHEHTPTLSHPGATTLSELLLATQYLRKHFMKSKGYFILCFSLNDM